MPFAVERFDQKEGELLLSNLNDERPSNLEELPEFQSADHIGHVQLVERVTQCTDAVRQRMACICLPDTNQINAPVQLSQKKMQQRRYSTIYTHFILPISN